KGQRMMVLKGRGGEGKSQIGVMLSRLFGTNMKDGSIGKLSENRFARADLEHILLCVDDDMRIEALRQTNLLSPPRARWIWNARVSRATRAGCMPDCWPSATETYKP